MSETLDKIKNYPEISFIDDYTMEQMMSDMVLDFQKRYKEITGKEKELERSDPTRLILYAAALQIYQGFQNVDKGAKMSFLKYSYGDYLDNLAALKGLTRSEGSCSVTTLRFILSSERVSVVTIPAGTRAANSTNTFYTTETSEILPGDLFTDVPAQCVNMGTLANDIEAGEINILVDPIAYVDSVENITKTQGGADIENDESLRERIFLAPQAYSVAGPIGSYVYNVKSFSPSIADVKVTSPVEGEVDIRFMLDGGIIPDDSMLEAVKTYLSDENMRPLTDKVIVKAPDTVAYNINMTYFIGRNNAIKEDTIKQQVESAVADYNIWQQTSIGRDINPDVLIQKVIEAGAKRVRITEPVFTIVPEISIGRIGNVTLLYGGIEND